MNPATVVFTGSFLPEAFRDSDADFNLGLAVGAAVAKASNLETGCFVAISGEVFRCNNVRRDKEGRFGRIITPVD